MAWGCNSLGVKTQEERAEQNIQSVKFNHIIIDGVQAEYGVLLRITRLGGNSPVMGWH